MKKIVVGLTGGIASGKSVAAEMFREAGAYIIDADIVAREITEDGEVRAKLTAAFPEAYEGLSLDRRKLRGIVFADGGKRAYLESVTHPAIKSRVERLIASSQSAVTVVVAPLLFEAGFDSMTELDITVECNERTRIERLTKRDNISEESARSMIAAQMTDSERRARADIVIVNDGSIAQLRAQVIGAYCDVTDRISER